MYYTIYIHLNKPNNKEVLYNILFAYCRLGVRTSVIELSEKVLTSADRLRCTLIHELCHAATWIFNGEGGHGSTWKQW